MIECQANILFQTSPVFRISNSRPNLFRMALKAIANLKLTNLCIPPKY